MTDRARLSETQPGAAQDCSPAGRGLSHPLGPRRLGVLWKNYETLTML